jgi:DNA-binding FrmR family transcriptional regulator
VTQDAITVRLKRVEGQIRGLQRLLNEGSSCEKVLTQLLAARSALDQIGLMIVSDYIDVCLVTGSDEEVRNNARRIFNLILGRYSLAAQPEEPPLRSP